MIVVRTLYAGGGGSCELSCRSAAVGSLVATCGRDGDVAAAARDSEEL